MPVGELLRHPLSPAALTPDRFETLIKQPICLVELNEQGSEPRFDWQCLLGYTQRQYAKLTAYPRRCPSTDHWQDRMVPYHELGLVPDDSGQFNRRFTVQYVGCFSYLADETLLAQHTKLWADLTAAEPDIFWYHSALPRFCGEIYEYPSVSRISPGGCGHVATGFADIEQRIGHFREVFENRFG